MRQDDGVRFRVRQIEGAAEHVAELVMQRHAGGAETDAAQPGAVKRIPPRRGIARRLDDDRQCPREGAHAFLGDQRSDRIAVLRVERLDRMGDGVDPRGDGDPDRQAERQIDVIDHRLRQDARAALRGLPAFGGLAENGRHLRAGVGGRDDDLRQIGSERQRLAEAGRRAAADRDRAIRPGGLEGRQRTLGHGDRRMHRRFGKQAGGERP